MAQGVYPAALQEIESEELQAVIQVCISYGPHNLSAAQQLLKNYFFTGIRHCMDKRQAKGFGDVAITDQ